MAMNLQTTTTSFDETERQRWWHRIIGTNRARHQQRCHGACSSSGSRRREHDAARWKPPSRLFPDSAHRSMPLTAWLRRSFETPSTRDRLSAGARRRQPALQAPSTAPNSNACDHSAIGMASLAYPGRGSFTLQSQPGRDAHRPADSRTTLPLVLYLRRRSRLSGVGAHARSGHGPFSHCSSESAAWITKSLRRACCSMTAARSTACCASITGRLPQARSDLLNGNRRETISAHPFQPARCRSARLSSSAITDDRTDMVITT